MTTTTVLTSAGAVRGAEIEDGVLGWRGLPYAAAPVGPLRLRPPQPVLPWPDVRDATAYGAPAVQPSMEGMAAASVLFGNAMPAIELPEPAEDCLFLNVTAPADATGAPVLVWLHGGGYQQGSGTDMAGAGVTFAREHGIVVVTVNYRLGALGFLALDGEGSTGAFGLHDQLAALRWVRDNIAGFGGDPDQVTIYGVSAGAKSVANLLGSPLARGLVHRAASSSGGADHVATPAQAAAVASRLFAALGTTPDRIRDVPAKEILAAQLSLAEGMHGTWLWRPMIDGVALTTRPLDAIAAGSAAGVPLLAQHCVNECFLYQLASPDAAAQTERVLTDYFGAPAAASILAAYRAARPELDDTGIGIAVMTDERYAIPTTRLADAQSAHAPVWRSRYDGPLTGLPKVIAPTGELPAFHGTDGMAIWSGTRELHQAWASFVTTGVPHADTLPDWPAYTPDTRPTMIFHADGPHVVDDPQSAQRAAWAGRDWVSGTWWQLA